MVRLGLALAVVMTGLALPAAGQTAAGQPAAPLVAAENQFAVDVYGKLAAQPGNFVFSPYSIATALLMTEAGAKGQTAAEMSRVLHTQGMSQADLLQAAKNPAVQPPDFAFEDFQFHAANALWVSPHFPLNPDFTALAKQDFGAEAAAVDFSDARAAAGKINGWVADETDQRIQNLVPASMLNGFTRVVLTDAVYFKSSWFVKFNIAEDTKETFHLAPGRDENVPMMHMASVLFSLREAAGVKILNIPYGGDASLVVFLPDTQDGLPALETTLNGATLNKWLMAKPLNATVLLTLPKFTGTSKFDFNDALKTLGMQQAFSTKADFTGIADVAGEHLYISDVLHKAYISVDENGTEAAAATAVSMSLAASMGPTAPPPPPIPFVADHPFLYLIRANSTGAILFMGRVDDPAQD